MNRAEHLNLLLELLGELLLLLIAPRPLQRGQLPAERRDALLHVGAELLEAQGETPQFFGIDNGLRHGDGLSG